MSKQYTIRSIPAPVDTVLKQMAEKSGKSFNSVVVEALERATGVTSAVNIYTDLDDLIGIGIADEQSFDEAIGLLDKLPNDLDSDAL